MASRDPLAAPDMNEDDDDDGHESPSQHGDGDVVMPVDGLPLPPDHRAGVMS